ncbi:ABC transporter substrate-binding protein [Curvibacter sp. CHRR-16]|nr:ABC transporter substrate-binding protein [Curvibacter sp. CHRR-16]
MGWLVTSQASLLTGLPGMAQAATEDSKVLRMVPQADLKILDPVWTTATVTRDHGFMVYDTLFGITEKGEIKPQMVDRFKRSADGKEWNFTLRSGLVFHDGAPVTSADVIASIKRWGSRIPVGQLLLAATKSMDAVNEKSFRIELNQAFGFMLDALGNPSNPLFIMPRRIAETPGTTQISEVVGSGPYIFKKDEYAPGSKVVYVKNPQYVPRKEAASGTTGGKQVYLDRVEWLVLPDAQTQANALISGSVDMIERIPPEQYASFKGDANITLEKQVGQGGIVMFFNHLSAPFNNPKIARAAMLAVNQQALMRAQFVAPEMFNTNPSIYASGTPYWSDRTVGFTGKSQIAEAKKLLKEAGYDGKPVVLLAPTDHATHNKYPLVMAALLRQVGFNVDMQSMDWQTVVARRAKMDPADHGGWNIFMTGFFAADMMNPITMPTLTGNGTKGWFGWATSEKLETLKVDFLMESDPAKKKKIATDIQEEALSQGLVVPLGEYTPYTALRKNVSGLVKAPVNVFWGLRKK